MWSVSCPRLKAGNRSGGLDTTYMLPTREHTFSQRLVVSLFVMISISWIGSGMLKPEVLLNTASVPTFR